MWQLDLFASKTNRQQTRGVRERSIPRVNRLAVNADSGSLGHLLSSRASRIVCSTSSSFSN